MDWWKDMSYFFNHLWLNFRWGTSTKKLVPVIIYAIAAINGHSPASCNLFFLLTLIRQKKQHVPKKPLAWTLSSGRKLTGRDKALAPESACVNLVWELMLSLLTVLCRHGSGPSNTGAKMVNIWRLWYLQWLWFPVVFSLRSAALSASYGERSMMLWITDLWPHPATKRPWNWTSTALKPLTF